ncbi:MAG TPA: hypothetical protein VL244_13560 [Alphaproteobacteria bacterium]|nr:hypothetical protein [Alphaproteobacteria bacterium]
MRLLDPRHAVVALAALLAFGQAARAADLQVGVASAVTPSAIGAPPSGAARTLVLGADIQFKERINTDRAGKAQIIFLDHSSLTIAPDSALVIDEFVYDPARSAGTLALSTSKGLLRYIGGKISKGSDVTFTTPIAMIAIRGGMLLVEVEPSGRTTGTFLYGEHMIVTAAGVMRTVTRPGYRVTVEAAGRPPGSPVRASQAAIDAAFRAFERGGSQGSGGAADAQGERAAEGGGSGSSVILGDQSAEATAGGGQVDPEGIIAQAAIGAPGVSLPNSAPSGLPPAAPIVSDAAVSDQHIVTILNSSPLPASALIPNGAASGSGTAAGSVVAHTTAAVSSVTSAAGSTVASVGSVVSGLGSSVANVAGPLTPVTSTAGSLVSSVGSTVTNLAPVVAGLGTTVAGVTSAVPTLTSTVAGTATALTGVVSNLASTVGGVGSTVANVAAATSILAPAATNAAGGLSIVPAATSTTVASAASATSPLTSAAAQAATALASTVAATATPTATKTVGTITKSLTQGVALKLP